jgi:DNA-binding beta-propeller fold protein YncE
MEKRVTHRLESTSTAPERFNRTVKKASQSRLIIADSPHQYKAFSMNNFKLTLLAAALSASASAPVLSAPAFQFTHLSTYAEECNDKKSCSEISAYDPISGKVFTTNAEENELRILKIVANTLQEVGTIDLSPYGGGPNSVAVSKGLVAVAVENNDKQAAGAVVIFDTNASFQRTISAGALPDMLSFTPNGNFLIVANEGEPNDAYDFDPEGSVTVINTSTWTAQTADFSAFNHSALKNVRVFGPNATLAQDVEPEYVAISADSSTAWISLQENNALAKLDIASATITDIYGLGYKKHQQEKNALDASNKDSGINIQAWPVAGMYQPDAIASYEVNGHTYIVSANEGDARDYDGFSEETRIGKLTLNPEAFPDAATLQENANLGRLKTTTTLGDINNNGDFEKLYSYGARSFSIWSEDGKLVADTGADFERQLAKLEANGVEVWTGSRSDDKGPEPESVAIAELNGLTYAFVGLERVSGIFVYDISTPKKPKYSAYLNTKAFGDLSPEGLVFIKDSENSGRLLVTNEVSNTVSLYKVEL